MTEDTSPENLRKFLESDDPAMVMMGLSMAKGSGVPEEVLPTILKLYMWDDDKNVRAAAKSVFNKYAPAEIQAKVKENWKASYRTLSVTGDRFPEAIRPFLEAFKSQDDFAEIALESLIKALHDGDKDAAWVLVWSAVALGKFGEPAVEPLIELLGGDDYYVRIYTAEALGKIGDKRAVKPLINALESVWLKVTEAAAGALGTIGDKRAVEPLIKAFENYGFEMEDASYSYTVIGALGEIGDERAVQPIIKALADEYYGRDYSSEGIRTIKANARARSFAKEVLKKLGYPPENLPEFLKNDDPGV